MLNLPLIETHICVIPHDYEEIEVDDGTVRQLDTAKVETSDACEIRCEGVPGRYLVHGADPSASLGLPAFDGQEIPLRGRTVLRNFRYIRQSAVAGKLYVLYYQLR